MCWVDSILLYPQERSCFETFRIKLGKPQFSITAGALGTNKRRTRPLRRGNTSNSAGGRKRALTGWRPWGPLCCTPWATHTQVPAAAGRDNPKHLHLQIRKHDRLCLLVSERQVKGNPAVSQNGASIFLRRGRKSPSYSCSVLGLLILVSS